MTSVEHTRRRDPDAKHAALLAAAIEAFTDQGYAATSMAAIARKADMAVGTSYRFYPDKISLLATLHDQIETDLIAAMRASWQSDLSYAEKLDRMIVRLFDFFEDRRDVLSILSMTTDLLGTDGRLPADAIRQSIADFLVEGSEAGAYEPEDPALLAALVHGAVEGTMRQFLAGRIDRSDAVRATQNFLGRAVLASSQDQ